MSAWELADLLGVHEHDITLDNLPNQPLHVVLELARRLDLHPGDLTPYAAQVYGHPRYFDAQFPTEPAPGTDTDAIAVLNALAHAGRPLTADFLAESLSWSLDRVSDAIERAWAYPTSPARTPCAARPPPTSPSAPAWTFSPTGR
ncbi:hypothetical protein [Streptomyces sp. NPDC002746]